MAFINNPLPYLQTSPWIKSFRPKIAGPVPRADSHKIDQWCIMSAYFLMFALPRQQDNRHNMYGGRCLPGRNIRYRNLHNLPDRALNDGTTAFSSLGNFIAVHRPTLCVGLFIGVEVRLCLFVGYSWIKIWLSKRAQGRAIDRNSLI